jgi:hypothetical protein
MKVEFLDQEQGYSRMKIEVDWEEIASEFGTTLGELRAKLEKGGGKERLRDLLIAESTLGYLLEMYGND